MKKKISLLLVLSLMMAATACSHQSDFSETQSIVSDNKESDSLSSMDSEKPVGICFPLPRKNHIPVIMIPV